MSFERQVKKFEAQEKKIVLKFYKRLCSFLKANKLIYKKIDKELKVLLDASTYFIINENTHVMFFTSRLPITVDPAKRLEMSAAIVHINHVIADGSFSYNAKTGDISLKHALCFHHCAIGEGMFAYILANTSELLNFYRPKLAELNSGSISLEEFMAKN